MYALAATAAGVSLLGLAQPVEAKIIYTKTNISVFGFGIRLDLTNDGTADFFFSSFVSVTTPGSLHTLAVGGGFPSNGIWNNKGAAVALRAGVLVGPKAHFFDGTSGLLMGATGRNTENGKHYYSGPWENGGKGVKNRYLGLKFHINGKVHYAWARLNFPSPEGARLTGYAYETIPNKPIIAGATKGPDVVPEPTTLGALAAGASRLPH
jgi:hypothetical protein